MRGKKRDSDFIGKFIIGCVEKNKNTSNDIIDCAQKEIFNIDEKIKEVEKLKITRSKLLDVVETFKNSELKDNSLQKFDLLFYSLSHKEICHYIVKKSLKNVSIDNLIKYPKFDTFFCIKQLLEINVLEKNGNNLIPGKLLNNYLNFMKIYE